MNEKQLYKNMPLLLGWSVLRAAQTCKFKSNFILYYNQVLLDKKKFCDNFFNNKNQGEKQSIHQHF
jgi:hypothetical protein